MSPVSVDRQIAQLRPLVGFAPDVQKWLLGAAAAAVVAALLLWHPWPLMIGAFLGLVGLSEKRTGPNIVLAVLAYDSGTATHGEVSISIDSSDTVSRHFVTVREQGHPDWEYTFIPLEWVPVSGAFPARIWRADDSKRPVLTAVEEGILIPRSDPKQVANETH
jgi:hypothetical protein